ncbi:MAG: response regulator transcription factor [Anaerocolumna aminovalerica]|jgi:DNA-binding response OmpR family regulator|uniref:response regulator transcription factor n=1 Tax=Anaerocolumna aminovalerica TaxID=1527 RepID=UPI00290BE16B|nr:response regulator transcription factor [Anaerocolumna aminovalerica]MDU6266447.1 response regulator transcription factor [Anaerocolumna aminovalerica]
MRILVIEDDKELCSILEYQMKKSGMEVDFCHDGEEALLYGTKQTYDVIMLDRMLPGMEGISVLEKLRRNKVSTPVIMVTAMDQLENRIEGLDSGADDYLTKPFEIGELLARIRALARRPARIESIDELYFSDFYLNLGKMQLIRGEESCGLSKREGDLLAFFIKNKGQILTRELILTRVWGADSFVTDGNLDNFIYFLRKRLKSVHSNATIKTIRSVGYQLEE